MQLKYSKNKKLNTTKATAEYKKLWVQHWKESGQSVKSFVALHGGARSTFQRWVEADLILENTGVLRYAADTRAFNESIKGLSKDEQDAAKAARKIQLKELRDQKKAANNNN